MANKQLKVLIVDDHDMVRLGLKTYMLTEPGIDVVGEADNGAAALAYLDNSQESLPDVILLDLMMPVMDGIETTREITARYPDIGIIMLTSFLEDDKVVEAIEAGAASYILKTVTSQELIDAIYAVSSGTPAMNTEVSQALARGLRQRLTHQDGDDLTAREREVLLLIAEGKTNKDIAEELYISIKTVKTHVSNLLMKCDVEDRTQLAVYAHRKGWVT